MKSILLMLKNKIKNNSYQIFIQKNLTTLNKDKIFLTDQYTKFSYKSLDQLSDSLSNLLLSRLQVKDLGGEKIGVFCNNNYTYLISLLAIWRSNGTPMCLSKLYPVDYLDYFVTDSKCKLIINGYNSLENSSVDLESLTHRKNIVNFHLEENKFYKTIHSNKLSSLNDDNIFQLQDFKNSNRDALLLYTSGTSGLPKGCLHTFKSLTSSIETMIDTWKWTKNDSALATLPLNHFSGLVYCLLTPFYLKAQVELMPKFNAEYVWSQLLSEKSNINLFIGVPTVFNQLIDVYLKKVKQNYDEEMVKMILNKKMRIIGSGSAALNIKTYNEWFELTNYKLLERYGMTEIGMALSNPYRESNLFKREAGCVGRPCTNCKVRIVNNEGNVLIESDETTDNIYSESDDIFGELQINGPILFKEYFNKTEQTNLSFTPDGWFKTGDTAQFLKGLNIYKIVGRTSVDIIKSGGYKISALDVERVILSHPIISDCAVMGLRDEKWGQKVFALIELKDEYIEEFDQQGFKKWCSKSLPKYSIPSVIQITKKIPRNQLGKVNKKELIKAYEN